MTDQDSTCRYVILFLKLLTKQTIIKATFEEFYGYLHTNTMRTVETFLIAIKLGIIT